MPVSLANIRSELLPGLFDVRGSYDMIPRQWDKVFKTHKSSMAVERSTQMAFVALPFLKDTLIQLAIYAGIPAGVEAFRLAREVLVAAGHDLT